MYLAAGPLIELFPTSGLTTTTFFFDLDSSFFIPLIERIGPMLVSGFPGAIITSLESCIAFTAAGFALALSAPRYLFPQHCLALCVLPRILEGEDHLCLSQFLSLQYYR